MAKTKRQIRIEQFGARVRELRLQKNLSQEQLAYSAGLEHSQILRIEKGRINTSIYNVFLIADALGVEPAELFNLPKT